MRTGRLNGLVPAVRAIAPNPVINAMQAQAMRDMTGADGMSGLGCTGQNICWEAAYNDAPLRGRDVDFAIVGLAGIDGYALGNVSLGATGFNVGDSFVLSISGAPPNQGVYVQADGAASAPQVGTTDGAGNYSSAGTWQTSDAGAHSQTWYVLNADGSGIAVTPNPLQFTVQNAVAPVQTYRASVSLIGSNPSGFHAGDSFVLRVTGGPPNQTVYVHNELSNSASVPMGTTDGNGNFSYSGSWQAADVGSYSQSWWMNSADLVQVIANPAPLVFTVLPSAVSYTPRLTLRDTTSGMSLSGLGDFVDASFPVPQNPLMSGMNGLVNGLAGLRGMGAIDISSVSNFMTSVESGSSTVAGYTLPNWALVGGGVVAAVLLLGGSKRGRR